MIGSTVVVTDAAGAELGRSVTSADGSYDVALDNSTQGGNITGPLTVTITGGDTICDFDNPDNSGNDCPTGNPAPNDFVVFGTQYPLPATFAIRSSVPAPTNGGVSHVTPISEIANLKAIELAGATTPTAAQQQTALRALGGLVNALSGVDLGADFTQTRPSNLANLGATDGLEGLVMGGISASILGEGDADLNSVINVFAALITINATTGNLEGTGTNLGRLVSAFARGLRVAAARSGSVQLGQIADQAVNLANLYTGLGNATVTIPNNDAAADGSATRAFVTNLATAVNDVTVATGAQGSGADGSVGATEAFASELDAVARLSSGNATIALEKLSDAVIAASQTLQAEGATVTSVTNDATTEDGLEFTLALADGTFTLSGVSSAWPIAADAANRVVITATDTDPNTAGPALAATASEAASLSSLNLTGVTMVSTTTAGTQTFTGSIVNTYDATAMTDTLAFDGTIAVAAPTGGSATGSTLTVDVDVTADPRNPTAESTRGTYTAVFTFDATDDSTDLTLALSGTVGAALQQYVVTSANSSPVTGTVTRNGATDVNTLTDVNGSILTLTVTDGVVVPVTRADGAADIIGVFTEAGTETATLNNTGVVTFADGSVLLLPSIIFIPDNETTSAN